MPALLNTLRAPDLRPIGRRPGAPARSTAGWAPVPKPPRFRRETFESTVAGPGGQPVGPKYHGAFKDEGSDAEDTILSGPSAPPRTCADDAELVAGLTRRERDPMGTIYDRHARTVFDYARCTLGQRALAEDVVQEVFLELWKRPERFDPARGSLRSYLLTLAHARSVDIVRSESARRRREDRDGVRAVDISVAVDAAHAEADEVQGALAGLSFEQREAIGLSYFHGYSYRDVATRLGVPEGTIKNRIRTGLGRLRTQLADTGVSS